MHDILYGVSQCVKLSYYIYIVLTCFTASTSPLGWRYPENRDLLVFLINMSHHLDSCSVNYTEWGGAMLKTRPTMIIAENWCVPELFLTDVYSGHGRHLYLGWMLVTKMNLVLYVSRVSIFLVSTNICKGMLSFILPCASKLFQDQNYLGSKTAWWKGQKLNLMLTYRGEETGIWTGTV